MLITREIKKIDYERVDDVSKLLQKMRDNNQYYKYMMNGTELGIYLLCPLIAGRSLMKKI